MGGSADGQVGRVCPNRPAAGQRDPTHTQHTAEGLVEAAATIAARVVESRAPVLVLEEVPAIASNGDTHRTLLA